MKRWKRIKKKRTCKLQNQNQNHKVLADEGERIPGIVEEMEKEDQDALIVEQCGDSSDDEDDERFPVLGEWRKEGFGNPVVQDIRFPEFEYRVNEVIQGAKYRTIEDVKDAVKLWAVSLRKEFRVLKSSSKEYEVRCAEEVRCFVRYN